MTQAPQAHRDRVSLLDRGVLLILITGETLRISPRKALATFLRPESLVFMAASFGLVLLLFPVPPGIQISWWVKFAGFAIFLALIPVIYALLLLLLSAVAQRFARLVVFEPVLLFITAFLIEIYDHTVNPILFGVEWERWLQTASFGEQVTSTFIILLALDVMFSYFVLPRTERTLGPISGFLDDPPGMQATAQRADWNDDDPPDGAAFAGTEAAETPAVARSLDINGEAVPIESIMAIDAEEHYVRVWTDRGQIYARYSFGRLVSQLDDSVGFSPRRGYWLCFRNIDAVERDERGRIVIVPIKGTQTVVPKAKAREVRQILLTNLAPDSPARPGMMPGNRFRNDAAPDSDDA